MKERSARRKINFLKITPLTVAYRLKKKDDLKPYIFSDVR